MINFQQFINFVRWSKSDWSLYLKSQRFRPESLSLKTLFLISTILTFELTTQCYKQNNSLILLKRNRSGLSTSNWLTWAKLIETPVFKTYFQYINKHNELAWNPGWFHFNGCTLEACLIQFNFVTPQQKLILQQSLWNSIHLIINFTLTVNSFIWCFFFPIGGC